MADNVGQILAFGSPKSGNHHDLNGIETILNEILGFLKDTKIEYKGLFLNADAGFDSRKFREILSAKKL